jgi:DNA invertase Pin-like site-specific DNA recombinase
MLTAARRRKVDVVVCWRLDRLGRNLALPRLLLHVQQGAVHGADAALDFNA